MEHDNCPCVHLFISTEFTLHDLFEYKLIEMCEQKGEKRIYYEWFISSSFKKPHADSFVPMHISIAEQWISNFVMIYESI